MNVVANAYKSYGVFQEDLVPLHHLVCCEGGEVKIDGQTALCLENLCSGYREPCIVDIKLGFDTTYPWASDAYNRKNRCARIC
jgi:hypothetical protein